MRGKRKIKPPQYLDEYEVGTKLHSKTNVKKVLEEHSQAESNMECSDEGDENITFIPPKPKKSKLNKVVNPGALVDRGTPNEGVWNPKNISSGIK